MLWDQKAKFVCLHRPYHNATRATVLTGMRVLRRAGLVSTECVRLCVRHYAVSFVCMNLFNPLW